MKNTVVTHLVRGTC